MKNKFYMLPALLTFMAFSLFSSCSKDKGPDNDPVLGNTEITMKVDGDQWKSTTTTLVTKEVESDETGKYHIVVINGIRGGNDGLSESLSLYINIPANKFKNPKGTYSVAIDEEETDHTWVIFSRITGTENLLYASADPDSPERTIGSLEITGFEIGDQRLPGQATDEEGYTKLSGNFHFEMYPLSETASKLKITEGKFNLSSGFDFDFN